MKRICTLRRNYAVSKLINQPFNGQLGTILNNKLSEGKYKYFIMLSAFAKNSGVLRIKESIKSFRDNGGKVDAFIGLDAYGTSYEALRNLFFAVDNLYIVHDNSPITTFHSKIYYFSDLKNSDWLAVGSNNLTGGGLWTNYESAYIIDADISKDADTIGCLNEFIKLVSQYKTPTCTYCHKIESEEDIERLLSADLIRQEIRLQIESRKLRHSQNTRKSTNFSDFFGTHAHVDIPQVKKEPIGDKIPVKGQKEKITSIKKITPSDNTERMWFETRAMTGGSRNILDLSMIGNIISGSGEGTRYETNDSSAVLGNVVFFDISPTDYTIEKNITINYNAQDYENCTIKFASNNGSWRIQLKGETVSGLKLTTAEDGDWFVHKIIVMEKIRTNYYVMSVLAESDLPDLISESIFVAKNGNSSTSKRFGLLDI